MTIAQKWIGGLLFLGALYLVVSNPNGILSAAKAGRQLIGGTEVDIITGGKQ